MSTLVISDLHLPFSHKRALDHCINTHYHYDCDTVVFTGDIFDHHRLSRFQSEPDADSATREAKKAKKQLQKWIKAFPNAYVLLGNHDLIPYRQAKELGIPKMFVKDLQSVYDIPDTWSFHKRLVHKGVLYLHSAGSGKYGAINKAKEMSMSVVAGHSHRYPGVVYYSNPIQLFYGLQAGCLVDKSTYAMRYSDSEVTLGCAVVKSKSEGYFIPLEMR